MEIKRYSDKTAFHNLRERWMKLAQSQNAPIFSHPEWYEAWWKLFGNRNKLFVYTVEKDDELLGIWPFCMRRTSLKDLFCKIVEPVSGYMADYHMPIIKQGIEAEVLEQMLSKLLSECGKKVIYQFPHILTSHPTSHIIRRCMERNRFKWNEKLTICPVLKFASDYTTTEKTWKQSLRTDVRRQRRHFSEINKVELCVPDKKEDILSHLTDYFEMYTKEWGRKGYNCIFDKPEMREYYRVLAELFSEKGLHFSFLKCGDDVVSYHFGFFSNGWLFYYKPTYNLKYERLSPSKVHLSYLIEEGVKKKWIGVDFLQGDEQYKLQWTPDKISTTSFVGTGNPNSIAFEWIEQWKPALINSIGRYYRKLKVAFKN